MLGSAERSKLSNWLEKKLKEYFARKLKEQDRPSDREYDNDWLFALSGNQRSTTPIAAATFDLRILDLKLNDVTGHRSIIDSKGNANNNIESQGGAAKDANDVYEQKNSHIFIVYQENSHSVGKELRLYMSASQFKHINPPTHDKSLERKNYLLSLDEHQINVYTKVFFVLKKWLRVKQESLRLAVPECIYGGYESEEEMMEPDGADNMEDDILFTDDDILSKVAAGMAIMEREKKRKELNISQVAPKRQSKYRLLILEDFYSNGFKLKNATESTFLSLVNVQTAVKTIAEIHAASWTFAEKTLQSLVKTWPFLENRSYTSYICERVKFGYPIMINLVREYFARRITAKLESEEDALKVMEMLRKLGLNHRVTDILQNAIAPKSVQCLIHQDCSFSNFLFRYKIQSDQKEMAVKGKQETNNNKNSVGSSKEAMESRDYPGIGLKRDVMMINWRTTSVGSPMIDVAFLLMTALPPKTRRTEAKSLLTIYWTAFQAFANNLGQQFVCPPEKKMLEEYFSALLHTCVLITGNIDDVDCMLNDDGIEVFVEAMKDLIDEGCLKY